MHGPGFRASPTPRYAGQAVLVAYEVYRGPKNVFGKIPGTLGRSEFGIEIVIAIAYLVYVVGLSFDKVCLLLNFFQNLKLRKSQADALLNQLSSVIDEIRGWCDRGRSCFADLLAELSLPPPGHSILDRVLPSTAKPSGATG